MTDYDIDKVLPRPWNKEPSIYGEADGFDIYTPRGETGHRNIVARIWAESDADHIVHCVNQHDALTAEVSRLTQIIHNTDEALSAFIAQFINNEFTPVETIIGNIIKQIRGEVPWVEDCDNCERVEQLQVLVGELVTVMGDVDLFRDDIGVYICRWCDREQSDFDSGDEKADIKAIEEFRCINPTCPAVRARAELEKP